MSDYKYLNNRSHYENLYDKLTVQECCDWVKHVLENKLPEKIKSWPEKEQKRFAACIIEIPIYFKKGERYLKREETIKDWMKRDQEKDEFVESHPAPTAYCPSCNQKMELRVSELESNIDDSKLRMMYLYKCTCGEKKGLYSDGEPYVFKLDYCPKCHKKWERKHIKTKTKITTKSHCQNCGYKEEDVLDLNEKFEEEKPDPGLEADKVKYCMSDEEGQQYRSQKALLPEIEKWHEEAERREKDKKYYERAQKIKKLTISELSDLLAKVLAEAEFKGLTITNTEIKRDLLVTFIIQDTKSRRTEYDSISALKKVLTQTLENTNWKQMTDEINYKLGLLTGRLRGIDEEKTLVDEMKAEKDLKKNQVIAENGEIVEL